MRCSSRKPVVRTVRRPGFLRFCLLLAAAAALVPRLQADEARFSKLREFNPPAAPDPELVQVIRNATVIDGLGNPPLHGATIVVRGNRIDGILKEGQQCTLPGDAKHFDAKGLTLLPGLLDAHLHIGRGQRMYEIPPLFLSHGVTAARDPGRPIEVYTQVCKSAQAMPRMFVTGPHFDQPPPAHPQNAVLLGSAEETRQAVRRYVDKGASGIKVYFRLPLELITVTCQTAHQLGIPVTAHLELVDADQAIRAGLDGVEHITSFGTVLAEPDAAEQFRAAVDRENEARREGRYRLWASLDLNSKRSKSLCKLLAEQQVFVSPTLTVFERRPGDEKVQEYHVRGFEKMLEFVGMCHQAGAPVVTGSHTSGPHAKRGWAYQREMELLVECGLTPMEVIQASTINNARFFGCADRLGSIEAGKLADFVLVEGDPLKDMRAMYEVRHVMQNGNWVAHSEQ